jgi:hypothetical protein
MRSERCARCAEHLADEAFAAIAIDRACCRFPAGNDAKTRVCERIGVRSYDEVPARQAGPGAQERFKVRPLAKNAGMPPGASLPDGRAADHTASRARPFALRALITARPALVFMRARKPCVRLRRVFDG